jgi:aryl sulfotransferase
MLTRRKEIVWLASFPKPGNTWVRILLSNVMAQSEEAQDVNRLFLQSAIAGCRVRFEDVMLLDSHLLRPEEMECLRPAMHDAYAKELVREEFVKTHDAYTYSADGTPLLGRAGSRAIYILRDPRDVAISLSHFWGQSVDETIACLNDAQGTVGPCAKQMRQRLNGWTGHVESWLQQRELPVWLVRYEDLLADTAAALSGMLDFLGFAAERTEIERAVRHSAFAEVKGQEKRNGFREASRGQPAFFREGRAGGWRDALTPEQIEALERVHGSAMRQFGYL